MSAMEKQRSRVRVRLACIDATSCYPMGRLTDAALRIDITRLYRAAFASHVARVDRVLAVVELRRAA